MTFNQQLTSRTALKLVGSKIIPSQSTLVTVSASSSANTFVFCERYFLQRKITVNSKSEKDATFVKGEKSTESYELFKRACNKIPMEIKPMIMKRG